MRQNFRYSFFYFVVIPLFLISTGCSLMLRTTLPVEDQDPFGIFEELKTDIFISYPYLFQKLSAQGFVWDEIVAETRDLLHADMTDRELWIVLQGFLLQLGDNHEALLFLEILGNLSFFASNKLFFPEVDRKILSTFLSANQSLFSFKVASTEIIYGSLNSNTAFIFIPNWQFLTQGENFKPIFDYISDYPYLIIDLLGNPGGFINSSLAFTSYFTDDSLCIVDVFIRSGPDPSEVIQTSPLCLIPRTSFVHFEEIVILHDNSSASAAELFVIGMRSLHIKGIQNITTWGERTSGAFGFVKRKELSNGFIYSTSFSTIDPHLFELEILGMNPDIEEDFTRTSSNNNIARAYIDLLSLVIVHFLSS